MTLLDSLVGEVQVQERRPKSWNEPRRKRLSFVRPHNPHSRHSSSSSNPDDWAIVPRQGNARHYRNDAETWDLRRFEAQQRFNDAALHQRHREHSQKIHFMHQLYGPPPDLQQIHDHGRRQGMLEGGIQEIRPREDSDNEIIEVMNASDFDDDDDLDDHHVHHRGRPRRVPLSIEHDHDRGRAIHDVMNGRRKRSKSKNKKSKKGKKSKQRDDSDSDDDDRERIFVEGVRAGIKASRERGGHGGGSDRGSPRDRRRFLRDDDSDDSMNFRHRRRSRSRGRHPWFGM